MSQLSLFDLPVQEEVDSAPLVIGLPDPINPPVGTQEGVRWYECKADFYLALLGRFQRATRLSPEAKRTEIERCFKLRQEAQRAIAQCSVTERK